VERRIVSQPRAMRLTTLSSESVRLSQPVFARGATNRDVAAQLHLSPHTVKTHVRNAFAKLGITSRAQLAQVVRGSE